MPPSGASDGQDSPSRRQSITSKRAQACQRCWKRKQKCDRILPRCTSCAELDVECITRSQDIDSLLSDDSGLTHASIHSYIASLQSKAAGEHNDFTQSPPAKRRRTRSELEPPILDVDSPHPTHAASLVTPAASEEHPVVEDAAVRDTMGAIGFLSNSAMAETRPNVEEHAPHKLALTDLILSALAVDGHDPSESRASEPNVVMEQHQIPISREVSMVHYNHFMSWSFFLPYIDHGRMFQCFEETTAYHAGNNNSPPPLLHRFTAYTVIATGIMMSKDAVRLSHLASSLHSNAVKMLPYILRDQTPLDALHCLALLISYSFFSPHGGSSWHLVGIAVKVCITLGLHKETPSPSGCKLGSDYDPRWLFWSLYNFDRILSAIMDRPFGIRDGDITVQIPSAPDDDGAGEVSDQVKAKLAISRHIVRQAQLVSNIRCSIGADPMIAYHGLCFWRDSTPPVRDLPFSPQLWSQSIDQLACRLLMQIVSPLQQPHGTAGVLRGTTGEVELDTMQLCASFINSLYERTTSDQPSGSFLDAYDILSAAVILASLHRRSDRPELQHFANLMNSMNKATAMVTQISGRFTALKAFQETLIKLSAHVMEAQYSNDQTAQKPLQDIPSIVPRRLRLFLRGAF